MYTVVLYLLYLLYLLYSIRIETRSARRVFVLSRHYCFSLDTSRTGRVQRFDVVTLLLTMIQCLSVSVSKI